MSNLSRIIRIDDVYTDHNGEYWRAMRTQECVSEEGEVITTIAVRGQSLRNPCSVVEHLVLHDVVDIYHKQ